MRWYSDGGPGPEARESNAMSRADRVCGTGALALALMMAGCVSLPREEQKPVHTFILSADRTGVETGLDGAKPSVGVLLIAVPQAQPGFDSPRMAYAQRPFEVHYYSANQWADAPTRMLVPLLVRTVEQRGVARAVVALPSSVRGDLRLDVDQLALVQEFLERPSRVRAQWRAQLVKLPEQTVIGSRAFETAEGASTEDAYGGAVAANRAVGRLLDELAAWAEACLRGPSSACQSPGHP